MKRKQRTVKDQFSYKGISLHTGKSVQVNCKPADVNAGIIIKRIDQEIVENIEVNVDNVISTQRCTTIGKNGQEVNTIEHLMSALNVLKIDNLLIEIDADEVPIADGSGKIFYEMLKKVGIIEQDYDKIIYKINEPIYVEEGDQILAVLPSNQFKISYTFVSDHPALTDQFAEFIITEEIYEKEIAAARTFGFAHEIESLKKRGLALGGSLDNAILIGEDGPINELRFKNEIVRHKILDVLGDIKLAPEFKGHIIGIKSGHKLNVKLAKKIKDKLLGRN